MKYITAHSGFPIDLHILILGPEISNSVRTKLKKHGYTIHQSFESLLPY